MKDIFQVSFSVFNAVVFFLLRMLFQFIVVFLAGKFTEACGVTVSDSPQLPVSMIYSRTLFGECRYQRAFKDLSSLGILLRSCRSRKSRFSSFYELESKIPIQSFFHG